MRKTKTLLIERNNPYRTRKPECEILEIGRATKRKDAYIKISLPDDLVIKIIQDELTLRTTETGELKITSLMFKWDELVED